jgi:hypothetical protein
MGSVFFVVTSTRMYDSALLTFGRACPANTKRGDNEDLDSISNALLMISFTFDALICNHSRPDDRLIFFFFCCFIFGNIVTKLTETQSEVEKR